MGLVPELPECFPLPPPRPPYENGLNMIIVC